MRAWLSRYVPAHFENPVGLLIRLLRTRDRAARLAVETALLGVLATPLDLALGVAERRLYARAPTPRLPLIFVCGAPRSGTTLTAQTLIHNLAVGYLNNLTAVFPRSPVVASRIFGRLIADKPITYRSYYGKSEHFSGPNDALFIWDRWLGRDRRVVRTALTEAEKGAMLQFFGACERALQRPLVTKNNNLNTQAHLIADVLDTAHFICMTRHPVYLAQSLLRARLDILGDGAAPYGIAGPSRRLDPVADVCDQVRFHEAAIAEQQRRVGPDRFWIVPYETFCQRPEVLVARVSERILGKPFHPELLRAPLGPFEVSNRVTVGREVFADIERRLADPASRTSANL